MKKIKKILKILLIFTFFFVFIIGTFIIYSYIVSPPYLGREIIEKYNIPYHTIMAHRGASFYAPESTSLSFLIAIEMGADLIELDVQRTKDKELIILHDKDLKRISNIEKIYPLRKDEPVGNFTYEELQKLNIGEWFNKCFPYKSKKIYNNLKILKFNEVLDIIESKKSSIGLYIETKNPRLYPGIEKQIIEILSKRGWIEEVKKKKRVIVLESFDPKSVKIFKELAPEIPRVLLISRYFKGKLDDKFFNKVKEFAMGIGIPPNFSFPSNIGKAHKHGLFVHIYTINYKWLMQIYSFMGADGFFTDRPEIGLRYFKKKNIDLNNIFFNLKIE